MELLPTGNSHSAGETIDEQVENIGIVQEDVLSQNATFFLYYYFLMPFCIFVGLTGNSMVWLLIRTNSVLARLATNNYLLALAATSSVFLATLFVFWIEEMAPGLVHGLLGPMRSSVIFCKTESFLSHTADFASVWLIVLVGFERLVLLYRRKRTLSFERARAHIAIVLGLAALCNSWILYVATVNPATNTCDIHQDLEAVYSAFSIFEVIFCMALPSSLIVTSNILLVLKLRDHLKRLPASPTVSFNTADVVIHHHHNNNNNNNNNTNSQHHLQNGHSTADPSSPVLTTEPGAALLATRNGDTHNNNHHHRGYERRVMQSQARTSITSMATAAGFATGHDDRDSGGATTTATSRFTLASRRRNNRHHRHHRRLRYADIQLTRSLLVVTWAFILLNLPNYAYRTVQQFYNIDNQQPLQYVLSSLVHGLLYTHHALLFYLYIFYSPQMKKRLKPTALRLLECYCLKEAHDVSEVG